MAHLWSDTGALRFRLDVVDREAPLRGPVRDPAQDGRIPAGRLLATASVDYLDRRDREAWPFVRIAVLYLGPESARSLVDGLSGLCAGAMPGFSWQSGEEAALGLQVGAPEGSPPGTLLVEVGLDLSGFLGDTAGAPRRPGAELALFRFPAARPALVAFSSALRAEVERELGS